MEITPETKIKPQKDKIIIKLDKPKEKTEGGIYIPENVKTNANDTGVIVAVGPDVKQLKVGDHVYFQYINMMVALNTPNDKRLLLPEDQVIGIIEDEEENNASES